jgi:hypothetical protein
VFMCLCAYVFTLMVHSLMFVSIEVEFNVSEYLDPGPT